jgi:hypothetical protein
LVRLHQANYRAASSLCYECLGLIDERHRSERSAALSLEVLACIAVEMGKPDLALELFGAADTQHSVKFELTPLVHERMRQRWWSRAAAAIGEEAALARLAAGQRLSLEEAAARTRMIIVPGLPQSMERKCPPAAVGGT